MGRWMLLIQRWEPIISPSFPSQIPFWIRLKGIPLHYLHEKVVRNIGLEIGELDRYEVTNSSTRIRVFLDGLKPLIMGPVLEFDSGEESEITFEYEDMYNHCSRCFRLNHLQSQCPEKLHESTIASMEAPIGISVSCNARGNHLQNSMSITTKERLEAPSLHLSPTRNRRLYRPRGSDANSHKEYQERVDRHGNPFGSRVSSYAVKAHGPRNKLAPVTRKSESPQRDTATRKSAHVSEHYTSPAYSQRRKLPAPPDKETENGPHKSTLQWQEKITPVIDLDNTRTEITTPQRMPIGRNLEVQEFPPIAAHPTSEEVLEEIQEAILRYTSVEDPTECTAGKLRVLQSERNRTVEETVARIIQGPPTTLKCDPHSGRSA